MCVCKFAQVSYWSEVKDAGPGAQVEAPRFRLELRAKTLVMLSPLFARGSPRAKSRPARGSPRAKSRLLLSPRSLEDARSRNRAYSSKYRQKKREREQELQQQSVATNHKATLDAIFKMATLHSHERDLHAEVCARSHEVIAGGNARERDGLMMGVLDLEALKMRCGVEPFQLQASGFDPTTADGAQVFEVLTIFRSGITVSIFGAFLSLFFSVPDCEQVCEVLTLPCVIRS